MKARKDWPHCLKVIAYEKCHSNSNNILWCCDSRISDRDTCSILRQLTTSNPGNNFSCDTAQKQGHQQRKLLKHNHCCTKSSNRIGGAWIRTTTIVLLQLLGMLVLNDISKVIQQYRVFSLSPFIKLYQGDRVRFIPNSLLGNKISKRRTINTIEKILSSLRPLSSRLNSAEIPSSETAEKRDLTTNRSYSEVNDIEEDFARWEQLYFQSGVKNAIDDHTEVDNMSTKETVRVVTFDLDNTLWKTDVTIDDANNALHAYLQQQIGCTMDARVEKYMKTLYQKNPLRYCPKLHDLLDDMTNDRINAKNKKLQPPVMLTLLRVDAIRNTIQENTNEADEEWVELVAANAFDVWMKARKDSIENNLATALVDTLFRIKQNNPNIIVGAITDGNSNPMDMEFLASFFDFCVNAETVGVCKPNKQVYIYALKEYILPLLSSNKGNIITSRTLMTKIELYLHQKLDSRTEVDDVIVETLTGPWWVHVGDDFSKDIVAAKNLNLRTIWAREFVKLDYEEERMQQKNMTEDSTTVPSIQKKGDDDQKVQNLVQKIAASSIVEMQLGAEDYLVNSIQNDFCDAVTDQFAAVASIIENWNTEAVSYGDFSSILSVNDKVFPFETVITDQSTSKISDDVTSTVVTSLVSKKDEETLIVKMEKGNQQDLCERKFCMDCGVRLPIAARFCCDCGAKQKL